MAVTFSIQEGNAYRIFLIAKKEKKKKKEEKHKLFKYCWNCENKLCVYPPPPQGIGKSLQTESTYLLHKLV